MDPSGFEPEASRVPAVLQGGRSTLELRALPSPCLHQDHVRKHFYILNA